MAESLGQASFSTPQKLRGCGEGPCWYNQYACQGGWVWGRGRGEEMWLGPSPSSLGGVALWSLLVGGRGLAVGTPSPLRSGTRKTSAGGPAGRCSSFAGRCAG